MPIVDQVHNEDGVVYVTTEFEGAPITAVFDLEGGMQMSSLNPEANYLDRLEMELSPRQVKLIAKVLAIISCRIFGPWPLSGTCSLN